jgi:predicted ATPase
VIAETHSENLLLRVRRYVVGGLGVRLAPTDVSIIYIDKATDGTSSVRPLQIDDLGQVKNWPAGFLEETAAERVELMGDMARRAAGGGGDAR